MLAALQQGDERLAEADALGPDEARRALLLVLEAEDLLERSPASDLTSFEDKRAYNALATKLARRRQELAQADALERGMRLVADFPYARRAVELLFGLALRRQDAWDFDVQGLASIPAPIRKATDSGAALKDICAEIDERLRESAALDQEVESWGWANLRPLMAGDEPFHFPEHLLGSRVTASLGALVGRANTRRAAAREKWKSLATRFRERLYLLGANAILWRVTSRLAQAEEAWKRHTAREGARWATIQRDDPDLLRFLLGGLGDDVDVGAGAEKGLARIARGSRALLRGSLRGFAEVAPDEWDAFARAYFFERGAVLDESGSGSGTSEIGLGSVARALLERRRNVEPDLDATARILNDVSGIL